MLDIGEHHHAVFADTIPAAGKGDQFVGHTQPLRVEAIDDASLPRMRHRPDLGATLVCGVLARMALGIDQVQRRQTAFAGLTQLRALNPVPDVIGFHNILRNVDKELSLPRICQHVDDGLGVRQRLAAQLLKRPVFVARGQCLPDRQPRAWAWGFGQCGHIFVGTVVHCVSCRPRWASWRRVTASAPSVPDHLAWVDPAVAPSPAVAVAPARSPSESTAPPGARPPAPHRSSSVLRSHRWDRAPPQ